MHYRFLPLVSLALEYKVLQRHIWGIIYTIVFAQILIVEEKLRGTGDRKFA